MRREAGKTLQRLGFGIDVNAPVGSLGVAQQQAVELAKALHRSAKVILLDEPTATLPAPDVKRLISVLKTLCEQGVAIIYISHRFEELYEFCHRVSVLRDGALVGTYDLPGTEPSELMRAMIGRALRTSLLGRSLEESGVVRVSEPERGRILCCPSKVFRMKKFFATSVSICCVEKCSAWQGLSAADRPNWRAVYSERENAPRGKFR